VQRPPPSPPLRVTPIPDAGTPITIAEGGSQLFELKVEGSVSAPLRYVWFLDDVVQAEGPAWFYGPDFRAADERPKEVKVVVSDAGARSAEIRWRVQVVDTNRSPRILAAMPTMQALTLKPGETVRFAVQGEDPDSDDSLDYLWSLDGAQIAEGERWEFKGGTSGARHRVEVAVVDRAGLSEGRSWDIAVEAPPLPPLPPLAIRTASPKVRGGQELVLAEGQSQTFSIKATGGEAGALRYTWHLDGKKQATGSEWTYKAPASAGSARSQEVRVVVSDPGGNRVEQSWRVRVNRANRPPTIVKSTPIDTRIEVSSGTPQRFTVEATDADPADSLAYSWLLDGRPLAKGTAWEMDATVPAGQHRVEVKVTDKSGAAATQSWVVAIAEPAIPPSITEVKPVAERITAEAESALDFTVAASAPGRARKDAVLYEWRIDNGASRTTKTGEFRLPPLQAGTYKLSVVAVSPDGLKSAPHDWTVQIKPKATKAALAESEVHDWLERYRRAWESKDVKLLVQLGEVTRDRAAQLREVLAGYNDLRVALKDLTIQIDADSAKVTFRREDTIDGKTFLQPGLKELWLEKQANGVLKRRR
jgi:hypothetical protein